MASQSHISCSECGTSLRQDVPFCPECGKQPPSVVSKGSLALELGDVPSQNSRGELLQALKSWFPDLDTIRVERRLKNGPTILITGIDQESGVRLLDALKEMKVQARLVDHNAEPWVKRLWNSGLVVSAISLLLAAILGGPAAFVFILIVGWGAAGSGSLGRAQAQTASDTGKLHVLRRSVDSIVSGLLAGDQVIGSSRCRGLEVARYTRV